jgi:hypothetical protein
MACTFLKDATIDAAQGKRTQRNNSKEHDDRNEGKSADQQRGTADKQQVSNRYATGGQRKSSGKTREMRPG